MFVRHSFEDVDSRTLATERNKSSVDIGFRKGWEERKRNARVASKLGVRVEYWWG